VPRIFPFFDLLPYRIDQRFSGRALRWLRTRRRRGGQITPATMSPGSRRHLYIDMSVISGHDAGTGIQRVVRALALAMTDEASAQWEVIFVAANRHRSYHVISWPEISVVDPEPIEARPGDVFLGLDFSLDTVRMHRRQLTRFRRDGGRLWFLICDLLPVERPEWFSSNNVIRYKAWLDVIAGIADGFLCISQQTENDLRRVLADRCGLKTGYGTRIVPMGYAIKDSILQVTRLVPREPEVKFDAALPFSLMVGTLEPRKGHADILAAFSELWRQGSEHRLVLVGRMGWQVESLCDGIRSHPEHGGKLFWFNDIDDAELDQIYQASEGLIIASHAEGFGLPLIEALGHHKPVMARDLPIFHIHEDRGVRYFPAVAEPKELARCICEWIKDVQAGRIAVTPPTTNWKDSVRVILSALEPGATSTIPSR
jgi:glycosyltransferase involved in cell wall biosynthesis